MNTVIVNDIEYRLNHSKKTATLYKTHRVFPVMVIPESITNGYDTFTVTSIKGSVFAFSKIEQIHLPKTITKIGNRTFAECHSLEKIFCDNQELMQIGQFAFAYCDKLQHVGIKGPVLLSGEVFYYCRILENVCLNVCGEVHNNTFANCYNLQSVHFNSNENIKLNNVIFWNCNKLEELQIDGSVYGCFDALELAYAGVKVTIGGVLQ